MNPFAALFAGLPPNHGLAAAPQSAGPVDPRFAGLIAKLQGQPGAPTIGGSLGESLGEFQSIDDFGETSGELSLVSGTSLTAPTTIPDEFLQIATFAGTPIFADYPVSRPANLPVGSTLAPPSTAPESPRLQNPTIPASPATRLGIHFETPPATIGTSTGNVQHTPLTRAGGDVGVAAKLAAATRVELPNTAFIASAQSQSTISPVSQTLPETHVSPPTTQRVHADQPIVRTGLAETTSVGSQVPGVQVSSVELRQIAPSTGAIPRSSLPIELEGFEPVVPTPRTSSPAAETSSLRAPSTLARLPQLGTRFG